jgi:hypothetical protein
MLTTAINGNKPFDGIGREMKVERQIEPRPPVLLSRQRQHLQKLAGPSHSASQEQVNVFEYVFQTVKRPNLY